MACARRFCRRSSRPPDCRRSSCGFPIRARTKSTSAKWPRRSRRPKPRRHAIYFRRSCIWRISAPIAWRSSPAPASTPVFPLWQRPTDRLARDMIAGGLETYLATVDLKKLPTSFAGRKFDAALLARFPARHRSLRRERRIPFLSWSAGPMFSRRIEVRVGRDRRARRICLRGFAAGLAVTARPRESGDPSRWIPACAGMSGACGYAPARRRFSCDLGDDLGCPSASISASVMVFSRGCMVTAMAIDFLPGSMPLPS